MFLNKFFFKIILIFFVVLNNIKSFSENNSAFVDIKNFIDEYYEKKKLAFSSQIDLINISTEREFMYEKDKYNLIDDLFPTTSIDESNGLYTKKKMNLSWKGEEYENAFNSYCEKKKKEFAQDIIEKLFTVENDYKFKCIIEKTNPTLIEEFFNRKDRSKIFYEYYKELNREQKNLFYKKNKDGYNKYMLEIVKKNSVLIAYGIGGVVSVFLTASFMANFFNTISNSLMKPFFDRWGKHKNFLAKLEFDLVNNYNLNNLAGYTDLRNRFLEVADELTKQKKKLSKIEGICLHGEPGNGKTQIVKALAGQAGVPIVIVNLNTLLNENGQIEENLNLLFEEARKKAPCIILLDEFDLIAGSRKLGKLSDGEKSILNEILQQLDGGKNPLEGVLVVANTNVIANIDFALQRPGRLGRVIEVAAPNKEDMREIIALYLKEYEITYEDEFISYLIDKLIELPVINIAMIKNYIQKIKINMKKNKKNKIIKNNFNLLIQNVLI